MSGDDSVQGTDESAGPGAARGQAGVEGLEKERNSMDRGAWQATIGHDLATENAAHKETYLDWNSGLTISCINFGFP